MNYNISSFINYILIILLTDNSFHYFTGNVNFLINIFEGTGNFEICEGGSVAVTGRIYVPDDIETEQLELPEPYVDENNLPLKSVDIYKDLGLRGYDYKGVFRGVNEADNKGF